MNSNNSNININNDNNRPNNDNKIMGLRGSVQLRAP